jgi:hypothetical protein
MTPPVFVANRIAVPGAMDGQSLVKLKLSVPFEVS